MTAQPSTQATRPPAPDGSTVAGGYRRVRDGRRWWLFVAMAVAVAVVLPVGTVASSILDPSVDVWTQLWRTELPEMLVTTVGLMLATVVGTVAVGAGLAWLVGRYRFPGQRGFSWLLVLPLAMPAYVLGFVYVGLLDHPGPVQTTLRGWFDANVWFPTVRSFPMAVVVMTLALYPYVYLLARAALREQSATTYEAARVLGQRPLAAARRVVLPMARPSLAAGAALVAMETLTDYATVQYFNVTTVSVGISRVWNGMYDRNAATELASLVLLFAVAVIAFERLARGRARYTQDGSGARPIDAVRLHGWRAWAATGACALVVAVTFVVPVAQLLAWTSVSGMRGAGSALDPRYLGYLGNSLLVATAAAVCCAVLGVIIASATRLSADRTTRGFARMATIGYAVPGPVVAVGVLLLAAAADAVLDALGLPGGAVLVTGTVGALIYAYVVRFLALGYNSIDASLEKLPPSLTAAALTLGARPRAVVRRVHLPLVRSGVGVALVLVAVDALKELPVVLLLRPFGFETLAVWVFQLASESRWEQAGLPALTIVAVAVLPVVLLFRRTLEPKEAAS
ncbi:MAG TPA: iron ABC transporter permease [Nocardioidaceae bacterium]|nr:iron ABC transporter permease [Nocardioidaceae bacterium]